MLTIAPATRRDATALGLSILLANGAGLIGVWFTRTAIPTWYRTIEKPSWNPPPWLFGPVWTALYALMGCAAWLVWRSDRGSRNAIAPRIRPALAAYSAQLGLNALWSPVFFGAKRIDLALVVIASLLVMIAETMRRFYRVRPSAALLLIPYLLWTAFATALNTAIWLRNR